MASRIRLNKEYKAIAANPPPFVMAKPNEENILEWHYVITGPPKTALEDGQYHGILRFPPEYPFKPPAITMVTPNGRFACNTRLCLSISDYHPDTWNPAWSVSTILTGLLSFMTGDESTTGSIQTSDNVKRRLARDSKEWNNKENKRFIAQFPDLVEENKERIALAKKKELEMSMAQAAESSKTTDTVVDYESLDPEERARLLVAHEQDVATSSFRKSTFTISFVVVAFFAAYFRFLSSN